MGSLGTDQSTDDQPTAETTESKPAEGTAKPRRSPLERFVTWSIILLLLAAVLVEARARFGYEMTRVYLNEAMAHNELTGEEPLFAAVRTEPFTKVSWLSPVLAGTQSRVRQAGAVQEVDLSWFSLKHALLNRKQDEMRITLLLEDKVGGDTIASFATADPAIPQLAPVRSVLTGIPSDPIEGRVPFTGRMRSPPPRPSTVPMSSRGLLGHLLLEQVQQDLSLSEQQVQTITALQEQTQQKLNSHGNVPAAERKGLVASMRFRIAGEVKTLLDPPQFARLTEIVLQSRGAAALVEDEVAEHLELTENQRSQIAEALDTMADGTSVEMGHDQLLRETTPVILEILSAAQRAEWVRMQGEPLQN